MEQRRLGRDGPAVSALGLGCMRLTPLLGRAGPEPGAEGIATIHAALEAGVTMLNTGDFYTMGANEALVGAAIRGRRDRVFLSVKTGVLRTAEGRMLGIDGRPAAIKTFCAWSLQRLGVDEIDLYQPARADPAVPYEETIGAIADLIAEGKVRHLGVSEVDADLLRRAHATHPVAAIEVEYSLAARSIEADLLPAARALGIGVVAYGLVTQGLLTGTLPAELAADDVRLHSPRFQGETFRQNLAAAEGLRAIAQERGATPAQVAIAWALAQGEDIVALIGVSGRARLRENVEAAALRLTPDDLARLSDAFAPGSIAGTRQPAAMRDVARPGG